MLKKQIAEELRSIVGEEWYLDSPEDLMTYSYDGFLHEYRPEAVIIPGSAEEISNVVAGTSIHSGSFLA